MGICEYQDFAIFELYTELPHATAEPSPWPQFIPIRPFMGFFVLVVSAQPLQQQLKFLKREVVEGRVSFITLKFFSSNQTPLSRMTEVLKLD